MKPGTPLSDGRIDGKDTSGEIWQHRNIHPIPEHCPLEGIAAFQTQYADLQFFDSHH